MLASPHYGERWGRHWLDLVSFAETNGHEFDNTKPDVWRYRDAVIRAFNQTFPMTASFASTLPATCCRKAFGTGRDPLGVSGRHQFFWLGERLNGAIDSVKARADEVDNQIDVLFQASWV